MISNQLLYCQLPHHHRAPWLLQNNRITPLSKWQCRGRFSPELGHKLRMYCPVMPCCFERHKYGSIWVPRGLQKPSSRLASASFRELSLESLQSCKLAIVKTSHRMAFDEHSRDSLGRPVLFSLVGMRGMFGG